MRKNVFWMLAALMLAMVTVSCSSDDDIIDDNNAHGNEWVKIENGYVVCGDRTIPNNPIRLGALPEWLKNEISKWGDNMEEFILLSGPMGEQHVYWFYNINSPSQPDYFYYEDGTKSSSYKMDELNWDYWACIYLYSWDFSDPSIPPFNLDGVVGVSPKLPDEQVNLNTLPDAIKDMILEYDMYPLWNLFDLLEGTWKGQHAYWYKHDFSSTFPEYFYFKDGTKSYFRYSEVDWYTWRSIYHYSWYSDDYLDTPYPELQNALTDIESLPQWLQEKIYTWRVNPESCTILEGTWKGQHAYWFNHKGNPYLINFFYLENGIKSYYKPEEVDWSKWKCIYDEK